MTRQMLSRRRFLQLAGGGIAAAGLAPILAACGGDDGGGGEAATTEAPSDTGASETQAPAGGGSLTWWWWGEQEAAGLQKYVDESVAAYEEATGTKVETTLLDTGNVIPQFTDASAAGKPPDLQYFWNGIYHMENVWHGYIEPLNGLVSDEVLERSGATPLSTYAGQQYRVGWYAIGMGLTYGKALFEAAGLDPDAPPLTWDAFLDACDKLKSSGVIPFGGGVKEGTSASGGSAACWPRTWTRLPTRSTCSSASSTGASPGTTSSGRSCARSTTSGSSTTTSTRSSSTRAFSS